MNRRSLLKALSLIPVVATVPMNLWAKEGKKAPAKKGKQPANLQSETEGMGKAMSYKNDTKGLKHPMFKKGSNCLNCTQYNKCASGDKGCKPLSAAELKKAEYAPCAIFPGKVVDKDGWCMSWAKKS